MRYSVFPKSLGTSELRLRVLRWCAAALWGIYAILWIVAFAIQNEDLAIYLIPACCLPTCLSIVCMKQSDFLAWVEIRDDAIVLLDKGNNVLRSSAYEYVRGIEHRAVRMTVGSSDTNSSRKYVRRTRADVIFVYIDGAQCFDDLHLYAPFLGEDDLYWCDDVFYHPNCIAFAYDEEAWRVLQERIATAC